jgi:hypothetical protein
MNVEITQPTIDEIRASDTDAIAACRRARADVAAAGDRLRRIHEAGARLNGVARTPGIRTSSSGLTRLQTVIRAAGISRQTANTWRKVGNVPVDFLENYIAYCEPKGLEITIAGLLARWEPKLEAEEPPYAIRFGLNAKARERFAYQLEVLRSTVFHTQTDSETVVAAIEWLYADRLAQRLQPGPRLQPQVEQSCAR